MFAGVRGGTHW